MAPLDHAMARLEQHVRFVDATAARLWRCAVRDSGAVPGVDDHRWIRAGHGAPVLPSFSGTGALHAQKRAGRRGGGRATMAYRGGGDFCVRNSVRKFVRNLFGVRF